MKKFIIVAVFFCTISITGAHAQEIVKGSGAINLGLGVTNGIGVTPGFGINFSYDYGVIDNWGDGIFTVGGFAGFNNWGNTYFHKNKSNKYRNTIFAFAPRATYRYVIEEPFEIYGAFMMGVCFVRDKYDPDNYKNNHFGPFWGLAAGGRYYLARNAALFAELGFNPSGIINVGMSFTL